MEHYRLLVILGDVTCNNEVPNFTSDLIAGISTCPPTCKNLLDQLQNTVSNISAPMKDGVLNHTSDQFDLTLLKNPPVTQLFASIESVLSPPPSSDDVVHTLILYAGLLSDGSADWILRDFLCSPKAVIDYIESLSDSPDDKVSHSGTNFKSITVHLGIGGSSTGGDWRALATRHFPTIGGHSLRFTVNHFRAPTKNKPTAAGDCASPCPFDSADYATSISTLLGNLPDDYCQYLNKKLIMRSADDPALRITRPCLYVFPEGSGQSAVFAMPGYNLLIDAGFNRRPVCWPVASYLDRLDAVLVTHWGVDNIFGLSELLSLGFASNSEPDTCLCMLTPPPTELDRVKSLDADDTAVPRSPLSVNLPRKVASLIDTLKQSKVKLLVRQLTRGCKMTVSPTPLQLYHKVGQGTLDLFTLTPTDEDSAELRKLSTDWVKGSPSVMTTQVAVGGKTTASKSTVPLLSHTSVSSLLLWKPASESLPILRILFVAPNAHQTRILVSLEALVASNICLRHAKAVPAEYERKRPATAPHHGKTHPASANKNPVKTDHKSKPVTKPTSAIQKVKTAPAKTNSTPVPAKAATPAEPANGLVNGNHAPVSSPPPVPNNHVEDSVVVHQDEARDMQSKSSGDDMESADPFSSGLIDISSGDVIETLDSSSSGQQQPIDPIAEWGSPQGLPPPAPLPTTKRPIGTGSARMPVKTSSTHRPSTTISSTDHKPTYPLGYSEASISGKQAQPPYDKPPAKPLYVDVAYLPGAGGQPHLLDAEWFKRVRARYYIASSPLPGKQLLEALSVGKAAWTGEDANLKASLILAADNNEVKIWLGHNAGRFASLNLDVLAVLNRSSIQLINSSTAAADQSSSNSPGFRLDF